MPDASPFNFPRDLVEDQHKLTALRSTYTALCARLPWTAEPHDGWDDTADERRAWKSKRDASQGYDTADAEELKTLQEALREATAKVITHAYWGELSPAETVAARMALKTAALPTAPAAEE